jgi:hypothetical protein
MRRAPLSRYLEIRVSTRASVGPDITAPKFLGMDLACAALRCRALRHTVGWHWPQSGMDIKTPGESFSVDLACAALHCTATADMFQRRLPPTRADY